MSNYSQTTFFGPKDSLPLGNPSKLILGTDVDTELSNIASAITSKYDASSIAAAPVGFSAGTAALPAIYLGPDTTTGWYRVAANQVALAVSATNAITVSSTGLTVAGSVTVNGAGTGLTVANNATVSGALTVSTGGSSIKGGLTIGAPVSGAALTVNGVNGYIQEWSFSGHTIGIFLGPVGGEYGLGTATNDPLSLFVNNGAPALQITTGNIVQALDAGNTMQTVGWRGLPQNVQTGNYTLVLADQGKSVLLNGGSAQTVTVPNAVFSPGDVITLVGSNTSPITITAGAGANLIWANGTTTTTGTRTLTSYGIVTIYYDNAANAFISGSGLS